MSDARARHVFLPVPAQVHDLETTCASLGLAWELLSSHDLPGGSLVWLRVSPNAEELGAPAAVRELVIAETGVVALLRVRNPGARDVLLPSDVILDGGKQAHVVERSLIIAASSEVEIPVRCVEAGRWRARDVRTAQSFEVSDSVSSGTREFIAQLKQRSHRRRKRFDIDQHEMWSHMASELDREELTSVKSSYTDLLVKRQARTTQATALGLRAPEGANAVAVVRTMGARWVEAFPSQAHVDASIASLVADLLAAAPLPEAASPGSTSMSSVIGAAADLGRGGDRSGDATSDDRASVRRRRRRRGGLRPRARRARRASRRERGVPSDDAPLAASFWKRFAASFTAGGTP